MAQPPILVDVVQIEPGSGDTLTVSRDSTDGALKFVDAVLTSGVLLSQLVGVRNITGVFVVGTGGDGAAYATIQAALDAVSASSSATAPSLVLVFPGVYTENVNLVKDGVYMVGLGGVTIANSGASDTITIQADVGGTTPQDVLLRNLTITNDQAAYSCVKVLGADEFAEGTVTVGAAPLATGDTVTINGVVLTGTAGARTSGSDDFSVSGSTTDTIAAEIAAAISDTANSFDTVVTAESALAVVTIKAVTAGAAGNLISLAVATTPGGNLTVSGALLAGGGAAGSMVLDGQLLVEDCELVATGAGGFQINASTCGHIYMRGGSGIGSISGTKSSFANVAAVNLVGVSQLYDLEAAYDTALDRPNDTSCAYEFAEIDFIDFLGNLSGAGSFQFRNCTVADLSLAGDRSTTFTGCQLSDITLNNTVDLRLSNGNRGNLTLAGGTPTIRESRSIGSQAFAASASQTVTFTIPQANASYTVLLDTPTTAETYAVQNKSAASFDIVVSGAITDTVRYVVLRDV